MVSYIHILHVLNRGTVYLKILLINHIFRYLKNVVSPVGFMHKATYSY